MRITDWDDAYANAAHIPDADSIVAGWSARTEAFLEEHRPEVLSYGPEPRQFVDLYRPRGMSRGLVVFVHGGYWQMLSGGDFAFLAEGALARGYAVAMPTYTLAPAARISAITGEIRESLLLAITQVEGPVYLAGHSAGGHLVTRMMCSGMLPEPVLGRVRHVLSISGVHDLRALRRTKMNDVLRLDAAEAATESPALLHPVEGVRVTCAVGADERPEFLRQTDLLANIWRGLGCDTRALQVPGRHHFDILDALSAKDGLLTQVFLDQEVA